MIRRPPRSTLSSSSAASDVYKRQRYPNTSGLNALLWDAVDSDPQARAAVAARLSVTDAPAKALIAEDADRWGVAWAMVAESAVARRRFQSGFCLLYTSD